MNAAVAMKTCSMCGESFPATREFFGAQKRGKGGLKPACTNCCNEYNRAYYANHREEVNARISEYRAAHGEETAAYLRAYRAAHIQERTAYMRSWRLAHPEHAAAKARAATHIQRARKRGNGGSHTADDVQAQYDRQKGRCFYCAAPVGGTYHVDHVVPLCKGGSNGPENLVIACPGCNQAKHAKHPMDFCGMML